MRCCVATCWGLQTVVLHWRVEKITWWYRNILSESALFVLQRSTISAAIWTAVTKKGGRAEAEFFLNHSIILDVTGHSVLATGFSIFRRIALTFAFNPFYSCIKLFRAPSDVRGATLKTPSKKFRSLKTQSARNVSRITQCPWSVWFTHLFQCCSLSRTDFPSKSQISSNSSTVKEKVSAHSTTTPSQLL